MQGAEGMPCKRFQTKYYNPYRFLAFALSYHIANVY